MLKTNLIRSLVVLKLLIDKEGKNEIGGGNDEIRILLTSSTSRKLTRVGYLFFNTKNAFNHLQQAII